MKTINLNAVILIMVTWFCLIQCCHAQLNLQRHLIRYYDDNHGVAGIEVLDFDEDNDLDIVLADWKYCSIWWWENDGEQEFSERELINYDWIGTMNIIDLDGDGDLDIAAGKYANGSGLSWWENEGNLDFTEHEIADSIEVISMFIEDMTGNGALDIITVLPRGQKILWENDEDLSFEPQFIDNKRYRGWYDHRMYLVDIDQDQRMDILFQDEDSLMCMKNEGNGEFDMTIIADSIRTDDVAITAGDLDLDSDIDIVYSAGDELWLLENDGNESFNRLDMGIDLELREDVVNCIQLSDFDEDSDIDLFLTTGGERIYYCERNENREFDISSFGDEYGGYGKFKLIDLDNDSDLDIVQYAHALVWYENLRDNEAVEEDDRHSEPLSFLLSPAFPNPFNSTTTIEYQLPIPGQLSLIVYNPDGQRMTTLFEGYGLAGQHTTSLIANDLPTGLYFVRLSATNQVITQKVMLIR